MQEPLYQPEDCPEHQFWIKSPRIKYIVPMNKCHLCGQVRKPQEQTE